MAESNKNDSSLNVADTKLRLNREEQTLSNTPENNTVFVEVRNDYPKGRFPRFNPRTKILSCHLHDDLLTHARSWKFVNLNISIKLPTQYVYTISHITSFLASKGLSIVPLHFRTGEIVRLIVEVHNISNQQLKIRKDSTFFEIRFMTHYNVEIKKWSDTYSSKTKIKCPIQEETVCEEVVI